MGTRIRKKEGENLSDTQLGKVFNLLNAETPITKKKACELLNISYNTTRLNNIMQSYEERRDFAEKRRKKLRNTVLTDSDISFIISSYLDGLSLSEISERVFRSTGIVKRTLVKYNIPLRSSKISYFNPIFLPDNSIKEDYNKNDLVYSARYNQPAKIQSLYKEDDISKIYRIWLFQDMQYAYQPHYELGSLTEVQNKFKIDIVDLKWEDDIRPEINKTLTEARRKSKSK